MTGKYRQVAALRSSPPPEYNDTNALVNQRLWTVWGAWGCSRLLAALDSVGLAAQVTLVHGLAAVCLAAEVRRAALRFGSTWIRNQSAGVFGCGSIGIPFLQKYCSRTWSGRVSPEQTGSRADTRALPSNSEHPEEPSVSSRLIKQELGSTHTRSRS